MYTTEVDGQHDALFLTFSSGVSSADLVELQRTAVTVGREFRRGFALVTDLSECQSVAPTAAEQLRTVFSHYVSFGLCRELRVVDQSTPSAVTEPFARVTREFDFETTVVDSTARARRLLSGSSPD